MSSVICDSETCRPSRSRSSGPSSRKRIGHSPLPAVPMMLNTVSVNCWFTRSPSSVPRRRPLARSSPGPVLVNSFGWRVPSNVPTTPSAWLVTSTQSSGIFRLPCAAAEPLNANAPVPTAPPATSVFRRFRRQSLGDSCSDVGVYPGETEVGPARNGDSPFMSQQFGTITYPLSDQLRVNHLSRVPTGFTTGERVADETTGKTGRYSRSGASVTPDRGRQCPAVDERDAFDG